jgi:hypothetical protein
MPTVRSLHQAKAPEGTREEGRYAMSAQGGSLQRRGIIELPIWPVAVLVIAVIAATIGMTMLRSDDRLANSAANGTVAWGSIGGPNEALHRQYSPPLAANGTVAWGSIGGPNEALHRQYSPPLEETAPEAGPIMINGKACMQCR